MIDYARRFPRHGFVASRAIVAAGDMRWRFSGRYSVRSVARKTLTGDLRMINSQRRFPACREMASIARICTGDVRRGFTKRACIVVAINTRCRYLRVIDGTGWLPFRGHMARFANIGSRNMARRLAASASPVVASKTIGRHTDMDLRRRYAYPTLNVMTYIALGGCGYVCRRLTLRGGVVVAAGAHPQHLGMINPVRGNPFRDRMASTTHVRGRNVTRRFPACENTAMAGRTCAHHFVVIDSYSRAPYRGIVTSAAHIRRRNMRWMFTGRVRAVVTRDTGARNLGMVDFCAGNPRRRRMTGAALCRTLDVARRFTGGYRAVVAYFTRTEHLRMINGFNRFEGKNRVTRSARVRCRNVRRHRLAPIQTVIVAIDANATYFVMVDAKNRPPCCRRVTSAAVFRT